MIAKNKINDRMRKKTSSTLVETIFLAKKSGSLEVACAIAIPTRMQAKINVGKIDESKSEMIIVPGKVLSAGEIKSKKKVYALGFSEVAKEKLKKAGCDFKTILVALKELKKGQKLEGEIIK